MSKTGRIVLIGEESPAATLRKYHMMIQQDTKGQALVDAEYVASLEVEPGTIFVIDPRQFMFTNWPPTIPRDTPLAVYHPLCDPPGTYSTKGKETNEHTSS